MADNSKQTPDKTKKPRGRGKPFQPGKGVDPRINRKGAPVRGESFAEAIKKLVDMTNEELADFFGRNTPLGRQFLLQPRDITGRDTMIGRGIVTLENDFDARVFNSLTDRSEGRATQALKFTGANDSDLEIVIRKASDETGNSNQ